VGRARGRAAVETASFPRLTRAAPPSRRDVRPEVARLREVLCARFPPLFHRERALDRACRVFDCNGDGVVDFSEFVRAIAKVRLSDDGLFSSPLAEGWWCEELSLTSYQMPAAPFLNLCRWHLRSSIPGGRERATGAVTRLPYHCPDLADRTIGAQGGNEPAILGLPRAKYQPSLVSHPEATGRHQHRT